MLLLQMVGHVLVLKMELRGDGGGGSGAVLVLAEVHHVGAQAAKGAKGAVAQQIAVQGQRLKGPVIGARAAKTPAKKERKKKRKEKKKEERRRGD